MPRALLLRTTLLSLPLAAALTVPVTLPTASAAPSPTPDTVTFTPTGAEQTYVVPDGVHHVWIDAVGANGGYGDGPNASGGAGSAVSGVVEVTPGDTLYVLVGGSGHWWQDGGAHVGGFNGGGSHVSPGLGGTGGGASDVRTLPVTEGSASLESRLIVAAGGGGGGIGYATSANGGAGDADGANPGAGVAGRAGTATSGGDGTPPGQFGGAGLALSGAGGAGGGGWYGGGGGSGSSGGGGGSSLVPDGGAGPVPSGAPASVAITPVTVPGITASAAPSASWASGPVTVTFTCTPGGAAIVECPDPVVVSDEGQHEVSGSTTDEDGLTADTTITVGVDLTDPTVALRGIRDGATYANPRRGTCQAADAASGIATCRVIRTATRRGHLAIVTYTARATDRAGHQSTASVRYFFRRARTFVASAPSYGGVYQLTAGVTYPLVVLSRAGRPTATDPRTGEQLSFRRAGRGGKWLRWRAIIEPGDQLEPGVVRTIRIRVDGDVRRVRITRDQARLG